MNGRELVILLLGLAIIAVILRGLYLAMRARRGQIRLAIDKNIPQNVDLDALEMAELPGGGARVVERSLQQVNRQNSAVEAANAKARAMDLGNDREPSSPIPMLMDAVELAEAQPTELEQAHRSDSASRYAAGGEDEDDPSEDPDSVLFDYAAGEPDPPLGEPSAADDDLFVTENPDAALDKKDLLERVTPDYPEAVDDQAESSDGADNLGIEASHGSDDYDDAAADDDATADKFDAEERGPEVERLIVDETAQDEAPARDPASTFEEGLGEFSMTAGERIGYSDAPAKELKQVKQSHLFDAVEDAPAVEPKPKRKSLFAGFGRRDKRAPAQEKSVTAPPPSAQSEPSVDGSEQPAREAVASTGQQAIEPAEVVVINVMAQPGSVFSGDELLQVLITAGLKFGDMNIFHQRLNNENKSPIIFSVANILNPGSFDLNNMEEFSTLGISLFLALPTPINNLEAFKQMLQVAQLIREALDGELKDDHRNVMTAQTIEHYRQRIRDFELRRLKAVGSRG